MRRWSLHPGKSCIIAGEAFKHTSVASGAIPALYFALAEIDAWWEFSLLNEGSEQLILIQDCIRSAS
ncbi:hypothetical protein [Alcanivorax sp.]|uniref:hypothetical protein n=1 Tax=Alcanivorax sp. TaxID=1872427 RepID=UPI0025BBC38A|nr:hypothetical protein [Alcanivorax sp.]